MKVHGLPESFWVVVSPSPGSELGDICFECDLCRFALQVRGGLHEDNIVAIFAEERSAVELAERLLQAIQQPIQDRDVRIHTSPWSDWFATQESHSGVFICDKGTSERVLVEPPREWGRKWAWNITEDGTGIVIRRTP